MNNKAFTLIELLVVVALTGLAVGITSDILVTVTKSYNKTQILNELEQQSNFASSRLLKELRNGLSVSIPVAVGTGSNILEFTQKTDSIKIQYFVQNGVLYRKLATSANVEALTNNAALEGVEVTCGTSCFKLSSINPYIVSYELIFKKPGDPTGVSIIVKDTVVLRGSY